MVEITNRALGPRIIYARGADGAPVARTLQRGETADVTLHRSPDEDPVLKAWVEAGEVIIAPASDDLGEGDKGDEGPDFDAMSEDELRAYLKARGITLDGRTGRAKLLDAARAAPAEPTA